MFASSFDVAVLGSGPAGLALALACAERGMRVACVSPLPDAPWDRSFGVWASELPAFERLGIERAAVVEASWEAPAVWIDELEEVKLAGGYVRLDVRALQRSLLERCFASAVAFVRGSAVGIEHDARGSTVHLDGDRSLRAFVPVDATGPASRLVERAGTRVPARQLAYGELVEVAEPVAMSLMDFRGPRGETPTFLYALPLHDGRVFVEETVLATRQPVPMALLEHRLSERLARMGIRRGHVLARERCAIPLGIDLPSPHQRVFAFGAAGAMVHPATGYQLARVMAAAPAVAEALVRGPTPRDAVRGAYETCWPAWRRRAWALYAFGMEALCAFDHAGLQGFMRAFFALPPATSLGFLRGELAPAAAAAAMTQVLLRAKPSVRRRIGGVVLDHYPTLTRALIPEEIA